MTAPTARATVSFCSKIQAMPSAPSMNTFIGLCGHQSGKET